MALGKGIPVINGFDLNSKLPLDSRTVVDTKEEMNALVTNGSVTDGQLCYLKEDKKLYVLKDGKWEEVGGGGGNSVSPTLNLINFENGEVRTTITEEEYNNLMNGLYNQVLHITDGNFFSMYSPSKLCSDGGKYGFVQFKILMNEDNTFSYSSMVLNTITIGEKNTSNEYPITVTEETTINPPSASGGSGGGSSIPILDITLDEANPKPLTDAQVNLLQANDGKLVIININFKADGTSLQATPTLAYILTSGPIIEFGGFKALICAGYFPYFNSINNFAWSNTYIYVNNDNTFSFVSNGFKIPNETEAGKVLMVSDSTYQGGAGKMIWSYEFKTISLFGKYSILVPYYNNSTDTNILPLPADASTSTYVLKAVNGVIKWVKES